MARSQDKPAAANRRSMKRLQFELALDITGTEARPFEDAIAQAVESVDAELLFVLPKPGGGGKMAVVLLKEDGAQFFLQVGTIKGGGFAVSDEAAMDKNLLGFARASLDVLERLSADEKIRKPLSAIPQLPRRRR